MSVENLNHFIQELEKELNITLEFFKKEIQKYNLDKIDTSIIEDIKIDYYGSTCNLSQIAFININNNQVFVKPFEKNFITTICKEINKLNLDLTTTVLDENIKIIYPKVTGERRELFIKRIKELGENFKINMRNIRRNINNRLKNEVKIIKYSKDDEKKILSQIQDKTDEYIKKIEDIVIKKKYTLQKI